MYNMKYNWLFMLMLFISPFLVISSNSWFSIWVSMEFNLMMFIMYLMMNNLYIYDLCMKYFLINSFSSIMFMFMSNFTMFYVNNHIFLLIINLSIMLKLGMMPFHFWFIDLMKNLNWMSCFFLSTWQKIIPFFILFYIYLQNFILMMILLSGVLSMIFAMNQIYLKKIYAYSSINHMCWMMMSMIYGELIWIMYFFIYLFTNFILMYMMKIFNINYLMDLLYKFNKKFKVFFMILLFSLGGLPPFLGFMMKWYLIYYLSSMNNFFILMFLIFFSLFFLYYYLRMLYMNMFIFYMKFNLMNYLIIKFNYLLMFMMIFMMFFMSVFMMFFYV